MKEKALSLSEFFCYCILVLYSSLFQPNIVLFVALSSVAVCPALFQGDHVACQSGGILPG